MAKLLDGVYRIVKNICYKRFGSESTPRIDIKLNLPSCYIFDMDGTLAIHNGRGPCEYDKCDTDLVDDHTKILLIRLARYSTIIIVSAREDFCIEKTKKWLADHGMSFDHVYMKKTGDHRNATVVKREIYDEHIKDKYNVMGVFDDRLKVVRMWYELGLPVFRVGNPDLDI
jgi:hypothetical protein